LKMTDMLFDYDHILMLSEYRVPDPHAHLASHIVMGIGGELHVMADGQDFDAGAVIIASDLIHTVYMDRGDMLLYLFDTTSDYDRALNEKYLHGEKYAVLDSEITAGLIEIYEKNGHDLKQSDSEMLARLGLSKIEGRIDERITDSLSLLKEIETIPSDIAEILCKKACLSKSRFCHLFKEQMGISLHRYIALDKMKKGYIHYLQDNNITEAAIRAGFDTPSHFASTCKRMFGISFSEFIRS